jgi:hypothetical protein
VVLLFLLVPEQGKGQESALGDMMPTSGLMPEVGQVKIM